MEGASPYWELFFFFCLKRSSFHNQEHRGHARCLVKLMSQTDSDSHLAKSPRTQGVLPNYCSDVACRWALITGWGCWVVTSPTQEPSVRVGVGRWHSPAGPARSESHGWDMGLHTQDLGLNTRSNMKPRHFSDSKHLLLEFQRCYTGCIPLIQRAWDQKCFGFVYLFKILEHLQTHEEMPRGWDPTPITKFIHISQSHQWKPEG